MAAFDTPWMNSMSTVNPATPSQLSSSDPYANATIGNQKPTHATFSPASSTYSPALFKQRHTIIIHQKSPLLLATPPQITRALAYSYPFLLPLNQLAGLLSWTTGEPWESFLLVAGFWAITIYGDQMVRFAGPLLIVLVLIMAMYSRHYSPLSSSRTSSNSKDRPSKHHRTESNSSAAPPSNASTENSSSSINRHQKSLDEIVETLKTLTSRCNILLDPFLRMTDFLSTQRTATTTSTRASLMTLFIRISLVTPSWYLLTLRPLYIITTKRVVLTIGTIVLTWHSRPARVSRVILWRSRFVRRTVALATGLSFSDSNTPNAAQSAAAAAAASAAAKYKSGKGKSAPLLVAAQKEGVRLTFSLWENQRRWLGIGWTTSMLAYERAPWTDEELNAAPPKERFELPAVEGDVARWRWVEGSRWTLEGVDEEEDGDDTEDTEEDETQNSATDGNTESQSTDAIVGKKGSGADTSSIATTASKDSSTSKKSAPSATKSKGYTGDGGWIYCDNKWNFPRRDVDGWGKYTRRRKWLRDAELVEITPASTPTVEVPPSTPATISKTSTAAATPTAQSMSKQNSKQGTLEDGSPAVPKPSSTGGWFTRKRGDSKASTSSNVSVSGSSTVVEGTGNETGSFSLAVQDKDREDEDDQRFVPMPFRGRQGNMGYEWGVGDDAGMEFG